MNPQELKDWAKKNQKFISLKDGDSITGTLISYKNIIKDSFGEEKPTVKYTFRFEDGSEKVWENGNMALAQEMADYLGQKITITRKGEKKDTKYRIKPATDAATPTEIDDWDK